ncbi:MAG: hypothetical protein ACI8RD_000741 [Bacillariaceae sp.]|jgi:hypothetical protein
MKGMKRMFGRKKKNNSTPSTAADTQSQSEPLQPSADPVDTSRSNDNTNGKTETTTTAEKITVVKSPAIQTSKEVKQEIVNPPPGDNLNSEKEKDPLSLAATTPTTTKMKMNEDTDTSSNTKTPAKDDGKRNKKNGRSPVDKKVNEVVVPQSGIEDRHATISKAYDSIPLLEQTKLPRGGISIETAAIGRVQVRLIVCFVCIVPYIIYFFIYMNKSANYV